MTQSLMALQQRSVAVIDFELQATEEALAIEAAREWRARLGEVIDG